MHKIKSLLKIFKEIVYIRSVLRRYGDSLMRGRYYQHNIFRALSLNAPTTVENASRYFDDKDSNGRMARIAQFLNKIGFFKNKNRKSTEEYEAFYCANNYDKVREVKLFSFQRRKILTICTSLDEFNKQVTQYEELNKSYNLPQIKRCDKYEHSFEIDLIELEKIDNEASALENIAQSTANYNQLHENCIISSAQDSVAVLYPSKEIEYYMKKLLDKIYEPLRSFGVPNCIQHGDLSKDNLIFGESNGKKDFWWIDWEHIGTRVFFYDYFFYIVHSAFYGKWEAFNSYMSGEGDETLDKFFDSFGCKYEKQYKFDYLLIYIVHFLNERVCFKFGISMLKKYYEFIECMETRVKNET